MARVRPLRVCHVLCKPDTKRTLIKILSKVSIRQFCTRFAFLVECGLYGWIVSQSACSFRKRPEETGRDKERLCETTSTSGGGKFAPLMLSDVSGSRRSAGTTTAPAPSTMCIRPVLSVFRAVLLCGPYVEVKSPIATMMRIR